MSHARLKRGQFLTDDVSATSETIISHEDQPMSPKESSVDVSCDVRVDVYRGAQDALGRKLARVTLQGCRHYHGRASLYGWIELSGAVLMFDAGRDLTYGQLIAAARDYVGGPHSSPDVRFSVVRIDADLKRSRL